MSSFRLALSNVRNNLKLFRFNILSMVVAIAVFFNFFSLLSNPALKLKDSNQTLIQATIYMTSLVLAFFILFFVLYSNEFFLKQRKKEFGVYLFTGVDPSGIAAVFATEELILGGMSLILGLISGMVFQKAFLMLMTKIAAFKPEIRFHFSIGSVLGTVCVFAGIFAISAIKGYVGISRSRVIDLLHAESREEKQPKAKYATGFLALVFLATGFYFSQTMFDHEFVLSATLVILCFILGTFLFFGSFMTVLVRFFTKRKSIFYHGINIISISNIAYRIRNSCRTLACMAIIAAATVTSIGVAFSVQHIFNSTVEISYPYSFTYVGGDEKTREKVLDTIGQSKHKTVLELQTRFLIFDGQRNSLSSKYYPVIRRSDFIRIVKALNAANRDTVLNAAGSILDGTALSATSTNDIGFENNQLLMMYGLKIKIADTFSTPILGGRFSNNTIILTDHDYEVFRKNCGSLPVPEPEKLFTGILVTGQEDSRELSLRLAGIPELKNNLTSFISYYTSFNTVVGVVRFTGLFLGIVFMLLTASIMYMKLMSDAIGDRRKYEILRNLGLDEKELYSAVSMQVGLSYTLPLLVGALYAYIGINALQGFLYRYMEISLTGPFIAGVGVYGLIYVCFYFYTTGKFVGIVKS